MAVRSWVQFPAEICVLERGTLFYVTPVQSSVKYEQKLFFQRASFVAILSFFDSPRELRRSSSVYEVLTYFTC